jgi:hypothetical protein
MKGSVNLFSLTVWMTVWLLLIGAALVVLGVFNQQLRWDIFSSQVEAVLYGVFTSSIILSIFGVAIAFVLGIKRIVEAVEALERQRSLDAEFVSPKAGRLTYAGYMLGLFTAFAALVGILGMVDHQVQVHRTGVFQRIASEQMQRFDQRFVPPLSQLKRTPLSTKGNPQALREVMTAFKELSFVQESKLYLPDAQDQSALWRYTSYPFDAKGQVVFQRFSVVKKFEEAIQQALKGNPKALNELNQKTNLEWYHVIKDEKGQPLAVLKIEGNPSENFREYKGSASGI